MPSNTRIVVIGASAGGLDALRRLLRRLPADFPAPILIAMHIGKHHSILPRIIERDSTMPVRHAVDNEAVEPGAILLAPPDRHLLLEDGIARLSRGPKENFSRPAIDPLFRTAAFHYRENAIGVILTGLLDDGTIGLQAIKAYGGIALVQDPEEADEPSMPRSALDHVDVDDCLTLDALADRLAALVNAAPTSAPHHSRWESIDIQTRFDLRQKIEMKELAEIALPSGFSCPECNGTLWEIKDSAPPHFRCHTGHVFTAQGLRAAHDMSIEEAVWAAIRALHEKQMLLQRLGKAAAGKDRQNLVDEHAAMADSAARHAETLRKLVVQRDEE